MQEMVRSPIRDVDYYLIGLRWAGIVLLAMPSLLFKAQLAFPLPSVLILSGIVIYNLLLSVYSWRHRPLAQGHALLPLLADVLQFIVFTLTARGYHSFYFVFILLAVLALALGYRWKVASLGVVLLGGLQLGLEIVLTSEPLDSFTAYVIVMKFILILLVGAFAIAFSELIRREEQLRLEMNRAASHVAELNTLLIKLGESVLNSGEVLKTILESVHTVPDIRFSMVLSWFSEKDCWRVMASTTSDFNEGDCLTDFPTSSENGVYFATGEGAWPPVALPDFVTDERIQRVSGVYLRSPEEELLGALVLGRKQATSLSPEDVAFLQSLALEASLALRNARLYAREQAHVARLERFQSVQRTYFSAISHELKTPLAVLKMLIPSLERWDDMPPETRREVQETMSNNLHRLEIMIRDSLESDRLEAGSVTLNQRAVSLHQALEIAHENLKPLLARKQLLWEEEIPDDIPDVWADPARLDRILDNLLGNAVKFSPEAGVLRVSVSQENNDFVRICIDDEGPGVPPSERQHIFDRYYTTNNLDQALAGVGLGLFIARSMVELHGGRIWVAEAPSGGGRFCFTLPIVLQSQEDCNENSLETHPDH